MNKEDYFYFVFFSSILFVYFVLSMILNNMIIKDIGIFNKIILIILVGLMTISHVLFSKKLIDDDKIKGVN
jgi:uncharacterized membrane protein YhaH (DUF805 family)